MSSSTQARVLLQALCKFLVPAVQTAIRGEKIDIDQMSSGAEAEGLLIELEKIISGIQPRTKDLAIEASLKKPPVHRTQDVPAVPFDENSPYAIARPIRNPEVDRTVSETLQKIRENINQKMPIRLLCFERQTGSARLKISLLEKNEVYDYLAAKVRADVYKERSQEYWYYTSYAILSHTWSQTPGELTYGDWRNGSLDDTHPKCQKLINFCKAAWEDYNLALGWIDTVCINKESSSELDESIRSMYAWYSNAVVCITYLSGTTILSDMRNDPWFTRGWTFQELVAPDYIKFYNKDWNRLSSGKSVTQSDKEDLLIVEEISLATTMGIDELQGIRSASISRRMQLAAKRQVTREEDLAYCLMGIFDISISTAYGEGVERAFFRLIEEIFRSKKDVSDIFNWAGDCERGSGRKPITSLFPSHLSDYLNRSSDELHPWRPIEPLTLTHLGLRTPILLMPAIPICESVMDHQLIGDYHATISIDPFTDNDGCVVPKDYHLLDKRFSGPKGLHFARNLSRTNQSTLTFGTLNVEEEGTSIRIPKTCLAVLLQSIVETKIYDVVRKRPPGYHRIHTKKPIVFDFQKTKNDSNNNDKRYYELKRSKLAKHGMELVTLYL